MFGYILFLLLFVLQADARIHTKQTDGMLIIHATHSDLLKANSRMGFTMALPHAAKPTITVDVHAWREFKGDTSHGIFIPTIQKRSIFRGIQIADFSFHRTR